MPFPQKITVDKYPKIARVLPSCRWIHNEFKFSTRGIKDTWGYNHTTRWYLKADKLIYLIGASYYLQEAVWVPLELIIDGTMNYKAVRRWNTENCKNYLPYITLDTENIEIL